MEDRFGVRAALLDIYQNLVQFGVELIPRLITAIVVLAIGFLIAKLTEKVLKTTFVRLRVDRLLERFGITRTFQQLGIRGSLSESVARLIYYLLVILFAQGAANAVGLVVVGNAIDSFFGYLPQIIAAVLVLLLGNVVAQFARGAVSNSARESGVEYASALGNAVAGVILFIVSIMAVTQLGIDTAMIRSVAMIVVAAGSIGLALSFGIGTRDVTRNLMAGFYARKLLKIGEELEIRGIKGTLRAITPTQTVIEQDGQTVYLANSAFLEEITKQ